VLERARHQLTQHAQIDIIELIDVQSGLTGPVLAELAKQPVVPFEADHDVERQILCPRREPDQRHIALAPGFVPLRQPVVKAAGLS